MQLVRKLVRTARDAIDHPRPVRYLCSRFLIKTGMCRHLTIQRDGYRLRFFPANLMATMWLVGEAYYVEEESFLKSLLRPGDCFVDVGANVGNLSLAAKTKVGQGKVIAVEAHPRTANFAFQNFQLNAFDITLLRFAAGDKSCSITFSDSFADDMNAVSATGITVPMERLDNLLQDVGPVRLLKLDVEGYELPALRGAAQVLKRTKYVYFEVMTTMTQRYDYSPDDLFAFLREQGFEIFHVSPDFSLSPLRLESLAALENLLAVRG